jgi:hypothetical protein
MTANHIQKFSNLIPSAVTLAPSAPTAPRNELPAFPTIIVFPTRVGMVRPATASISWLPDGPHGR